MDKIKLLDLGVLPEITTTLLQIGDAAIEVTPRIPYEQVLNMMQWCIDFIINDRPFISAPLKKMIKDFAILKYYTNLDLSFFESECEIDEVYGNYDIIDRYGILDKIYPALDQRQLAFFNKTLDETLESIITYRNSAKGMIDAITENSQDSINKMQEAIDMFKDEEQNKQLANLINISKIIE